MGNADEVNIDLMEVPKRLPRLKEPNRPYLKTYASARLAAHPPVTPKVLFGKAKVNVAQVESGEETEEVEVRAAAAETPKATPKPSRAHVAAAAALAAASPSVPATVPATAPRDRPRDR